jgi:hypothetical protein
MSRPLRHRPALLAAALAASAPLVVVGAAYADPTPTPTSQTGPVVEFSGGCLILLCSSRPDTEELTVAAESTVTFVNGLGSRARLYLDGQAFDPPVPGGSGIEVRFHRGPVEVAMGRGGLGDHKPVVVSVGRPPHASSPSTPAPDGPSTPVPATWGPAAPPTSSPGSGDVLPAGTAAQREDTDEAASAPEAVDALPAGEPGGTSAGGEGGPGAAEMPDDAGLPPTDPAAVATYPAPAGMGTGPAAEPLAAVHPAGDGRLTGLLALIAAVCVAGASVALIRAIATQRARRTGAA